LNLHFCPVSVAKNPPAVEWLACIPRGLKWIEGDGRGAGVFDDCIRGETRNRLAAAAAVNRIEELRTRDSNDIVERALAPQWGTRR
jgi:hypothetical protein